MISLNESDLETLIKKTVNEMAYPISFDIQTFKQLRSFAERIRYCDSRLMKLGSGSGRIAYKIDDEKVLKIAKNAKGIAQNSVESEGYIQNYGIAARVFETDDNDSFLEMELARKCSKPEFRKLTGFDISLVDPYLTKRFKNNRWQPQISPEDVAMLNENEWMSDLGELVGDYDMPLGDVARISSYGIVKRDGGDAVVLIDFGLTQGVYDEFYSRK